MRYFYEKSSIQLNHYGETYHCNHPLYNDCTLYSHNGKGFAVIRQYYDPITKHTWWGALDPGLANDIYLNEGFSSCFKEYAGEPVNDIYPTVKIRKIMWALRMKPLQKEPWESIL